jgi:RND family efflux transporter MFP subunit
MKRQSWLFLGLSLAAVAIGYRQLPSDTRRQMTGWFLREAAIAVRVVPVKKTAIPAVVQGAGKLQVMKEVDVVSAIAGRVSDIRSQVGESVREGQILATVRSPELLKRLERAEAALEASEADLRQKESQLAAAEKDLERARELRNRDLIAGRDLSEAEAASDTARAAQALAQSQVAQHQAALEQTRTLLSFSKLVAPVSGMVIRALVEPGAQVQSSMPVFTIASLDSLKVMIDTPARDVDFIHPGMTARIRPDALSGRVFQGQVSVLHAKAAPDQSVVVEIHVNNRDRRLTPGMSVAVTLDPLTKRDVLLVPQQALFKIQGQNCVYVVVNERIQTRAVITGRMVEDMIEIESGVGAGDWVVVSERSLIKADSKVRPLTDKVF